jgi:hypothetical protein
MSDKRVSMDMDEIIQDSRDLAEKVAYLFNTDKVDVGTGIAAALQVAVVGSVRAQMSIGDFMRLMARVYETVTGAEIHTLAIPMPEDTAVPITGMNGGNKGGMLN